MFISISVDLLAQDRWASALFVLNGHTFAIVHVVTLFIGQKRIVVDLIVGSLFSGGCGCLLFVWFLVEIVEKEIEENGVRQGEEDRPTRIAAIRVDKLSRVKERHDELDHLNVGDVLLPPQIFLELRSHRSQQVIRIHNDVHEWVDGSWCKENYSLKREKLFWTSFMFILPINVPCPPG